MNRDKVLELARDAGLFSTEVHVLMPKLERFAALIEAEMCKHQADKFCETHCSWTDHHVDCDQVRGDAEPVAWMYEWGEKKHLTFTDQSFIEKSHPHFNKSSPLYLHPAPAVVRQPLTEEQIGLLTTEPKCSHVEVPVLLEFARAVERAHGIGGNDE